MGKTTIIIVAAGKGLRMGAELPKQFLSLSSRPILMRTIERFAVALPDAEIIVALSKDYVDYWKELCGEYQFNTEHLVVEGGDTRFESVRKCIEAISDTTERVLIHDGVRPFVSKDLILRVKETLSRCDAVIPAVDVIDSIRKIVSPTQSHVVDRNTLKAIQTPQGFKKDILQNSYRKNYRPEFTDDATVVEFSGYSLCIVEGERNNIKITTSEDLEQGEFIFSKER